MNEQLLGRRANKSVVWLTIMVFVLFLSLLLSSRSFALEGVDWRDAYPSGVGIELGDIPVSSGMKAWAGDRPEGLETGVLQNKGYWKTNKGAAAPGTNYFYFNIDDSYAFNLKQEDMLVTVEYYDEGSGQLSLQYDSADASLKDAPLLTYGDTKQWKSYAFLLTDAKFNNRLNGADFRIGIEGGGAIAATNRDLLISSVKVSRIGAKIQLGATTSGSNLTASAGDNKSGLITGIKDGKSYWQTNRAAPAPSTLYFYMNVADTYLYDNKDYAVFVTVEYYDEGNGKLGLQYDSPGTATSDKFKSAPVFTYGDTKTWKTYTFGLQDAIMTNRSNSSDFRIATNSTQELMVSSVKVTRIPKILNLKEGLKNMLAKVSKTVASAREGEREGMYPVGSKAELQAAIDKGMIVFNDLQATQQAIDTALTELVSALQKFTKSVITFNIALGAKATASSEDGRAAARTVDGDSTTGWVSGSNHGSEWIKYDLGSSKPFNDIAIRWAPAYARDYTIEVSDDDVNYSRVKTEAAASGQTIISRFEKVSARYVKVSMSGYASNFVNFSILEVEIRLKWGVVPQSKLITTNFATEDHVIADFDLSDYGVDSTGVQDATAKIQKALYDCYDAGGGTVWMPAGTYRVINTLEIGAFCTLRGDYRDPDQGEGSYGTVIKADLPSGDNGPTLLRIGGSAGVMGVTIFYPNQKASNPIPYNFTFEVPGNAWIGGENNTTSTISDVTMLNSYRGIGISTMPSDRGMGASAGQIHATATVRNIKGTVLYQGVMAYNGADVGTWERVTLDNRYWANAGAAYNAPDITALNAWTRANGTGFIFGDLEWDQFYKLKASNYKIGIHVVVGQRAGFCGEFLQTEIRNTDIALLVDNYTSRWGMSFGNSVLEGSQYAIKNNANVYVKVTDTILTGKTEGIVHLLTAEMPEYTESAAPKAVRAALYDVSKAPYNAPRASVSMPTEDATNAIQAALRDAGEAGGGIVYLPAGWYKVLGHLIIPANVELRGSSSVPNQDLQGASRGTVLFAFEGRNTKSPEQSTAFITLNGDHAGVRGLRVFYPENNPAGTEGIVPYPFTFRGNGNGTYVINVGLPNAYNGIDLKTNQNDNHYIRRVTGIFFNYGIVIGQSNHGRIEGIITNPSALALVGFPGWSVGNAMQQVVEYTRKHEKLIVVDGSLDENIMNFFAYGANTGLTVITGQVQAFNMGTDNLGSDGYSVNVDQGQVKVMNLMRYNGKTSKGNADLYNIMALGLVQFSVNASVQAEGMGDISVIGNPTEPGKFEEGSQAAVTATPRTGYQFEHWTENGSIVSEEKTYSFPVTVNRNLIATFADKTPPVTTDDAPTGWVNKDVTIHLIASDSGSVVAATYYKLDRDLQQTGIAINIVTEGIHSLEYWSTDNAGNTEQPHIIQVRIDKTAPETKAVATPSQPNGSNEWFVHPMTVSLNVYDNMSGTSKTEYSLNDGSTWQSYTGPVNVKLDGKYLWSYRSTDQAGNVETVKTSSFNLDTTAPTISVTGFVYGTLSDARDLLPVITLNDNLSGVDSDKTKATLDTIAYKLGENIPLYKLPLGPHSLIVNASDMAGNTASVTVTFQTYASLDSLKELVTHFTSNGWIDNAGIANSLQTKLNKGKVGEFMQEVRAQSGKHLTKEASDYLLRDAQAVIDSLAAKVNQYASNKSLTRSTNDSKED